MTSKIALVTGAPSGIGEATALRLKQPGSTVYGAARRIDRMQTLAGAGIRILAMDVTDDASMQAGIDRIIAVAAVSTSSSTMPAMAPVVPLRTCRWRRPAPSSRSTCPARSG